MNKKLQYNNLYTKELYKGSFLLYFLWGPPDLYAKLNVWDKIMGCIYYHKNKINGHMYIGQSVCNSTNVKYGRWGKYGQGYKSNKYFWN